MIRQEKCGVKAPQAGEACKEMSDDNVTMIETDAPPALGAHLPLRERERESERNDCKVSNIKHEPATRSAGQAELPEMHARIRSRLRTHALCQQCHT